MCVVCIEWQIGKLTSKEALRNLGELIRAEKEDNGEDNGHYYKVVDDILEKEIGKLEDISETEALWQKEIYGNK